VDNPSPRRREQRPFESWAELDAIAAHLSPRYRPMVIFAAATGLRPAEWLALERRDIDLEARVVYVHRSFTKGRLKCPKTEASRRAVPLQTIGIEAIKRQPPHPHSPLLFPAERGGYLDLHNFRNREWKPAQVAAGIEPQRRIYDLRHTFATFALRAGISHLRPLPLHGREPDHDRPPLRPPNARRTRARDQAYSTSSAPTNVHRGRWWTLRGRQNVRAPPPQTTEVPAKQAKPRSPQTDSNRRPPPYHRSRAARFFLQISLIWPLRICRETSCVSFLMCPFCVRVSLTR
jgi:hypothetical protein